MMWNLGSEGLAARRIKVPDDLTRRNTAITPRNFRAEHCRRALRVMPHTTQDDAPTPTVLAATNPAKLAELAKILCLPAVDSPDRSSTPHPRLAEILAAAS